MIIRRTGLRGDSISNFPSVVSPSIACKTLDDFRAFAVGGYLVISELRRTILKRSDLSAFTKIPNLNVKLLTPSTEVGEFKPEEIAMAALEAVAVLEELEGKLSKR